MKLATYQDGSRDGQLVVVSRDLTLAHYASGGATRLQQVLDDWSFLSPQLEEISQTLNHGRARHAFAFEPEKCMAPLPRAYRWATGAALARHTELRMYQGASDAFIGARGDIVATRAEHGIDFGAGIAVVTGDVAMGTPPDAAIEGIRLLMLANDVSLRTLVADELANGVGPGFDAVQSKPATAFSPVAVTPDELLHAWNGGRVHLDLECVLNGKRVALCGAGDAMTFHFGELIAHLCRTRGVRAGSVIGSGPVNGTIEGGAPKTEFMQFGDTVCIEMKGLDGTSVFGAIEQKVVAAGWMQRTPPP